MDDSTKILAVSYGNFSCRLEGFEDSVETMKAVVSYFHELAGHDRFMDMEPQAPDMATLARLTEEQVGAPVDVEGSGNQVSLRRLDAPAETDDDELAEDLEMLEEEAASESADEDDLSTEDALDADNDTIVLNSDASETEETSEAETVAEDDVQDNSVAARLQRIRTVVGDGAQDENDGAAGEETETEPQTETPVRAGVNPLAQRLADLAKRNAERAAEEAGVVLEIDDEDDEDDISAEELAELDAEFKADESADATDDVLQLAPEDLASDTGPQPDETDGGPIVLKPEEETPSRGGDYGEGFNLKEEVAEAQREIQEIIEEKEARSKHDDVLDNVDKNMTRIMSQTDEHLNEPEGRRHRDAFAQLKAAVAATEAARQLGDPGGEGRDKNEVFREDLGALDAEEAQGQPSESDEDLDASADAETANDTSGDEGPTEASDASNAPAPLKLVSSQIVEPGSAPLDAASARLRQIAAQKETSGVAKGGFAEFASEHGATELADLLEAAAAYIAFVEGETDFSRPQVMKKVQTASAEEFTREDGLRSFGRLLRQSRIIKLNNGRFQVAENTRFRPGEKAAQG